MTNKLIKYWTTCTHCNLPYSYTITEEDTPNKDLVFCNNCNMNHLGDDRDKIK